METVSVEKIEKSYPTAPDADGFFYESAYDETSSVFTKVYENGTRIKKLVLPLSGKVAVVRELLGKDTKEIARFMDKNMERYETAAITVATTLNGEKQPFEVFESLKMKDYTRLMAVCQDLNF